MDVESEISSLEKRIAHQEELHKDISLTPRGFMHGVISGLPVIISAVILSAIVATFICKTKAK